MVLQQANPPFTSLPQEMDRTWNCKENQRFVENKLQRLGLLPPAPVSPPPQTALGHYVLLLISYLDFSRINMRVSALDPWTCEELWNQLDHKLYPFFVTNLFPTKSGQENSEIGLTLTVLYFLFRASIGDWASESRRMEKFQVVSLLRGTFSK